MQVVGEYIDSKFTVENFAIKEQINELRQKQRHNQSLEIEMMLDEDKPSVRESAMIRASPEETANATATSNVKTVITQQAITKMKKACLKRKDKEGYNALDMKVYLDWLRNNKFIKGFTWHSIPSHRFKLNRVYRGGDSNGWVFFGYSLKSDYKAKLASQLKKITHVCPRKQEELRETYMESQFQKCKSIWTHGVGIRRENKNGVITCYIYDNGCIKRSEYSVMNLAKRISVPFIVRAFDISV